MRSPSPELVALAGPNGAGKSTVGPALLRESLGISIFVNADVIAQGLSGLEPEGVAFEAGRIMLERLDDLAQRRATFAFETTLSGRAYARRISAMLRTGTASTSCFSGWIAQSWRWLGSRTEFAPAATRSRKR